VLFTSITTSLNTPAYAKDEVLNIKITKGLKQEQAAPTSTTIISRNKQDTIFANGDDIKALSSQVSSLYVESSNGRIAPRFYIRGLGNVDFDLSASQPVSVIFDDVVQENVILKSSPLFDLEKIEVMRGPQGTLFGRNTTAGVVKFSTRKPTVGTDGYIKLNYGTFNTSNFEGAIGGTLIDNKLLGRVSLLSQKRDDWINNNFTGENDTFGGHNELAARTQFLFTPTDDFSALFNVHHRDLEGSQTAFRANIFTKGNNALNENYDRGSVFYDGGNNNTQEYTGSGASLKLDWDMENHKFTSITALEQADGTNTGDIDGGVAGVGPGLIPFSSATVDAGDVEQFTQEFLFSNDDNSQWQWLVGTYYFNSDLRVTTDTGFNTASVDHHNEALAGFANIGYQFTPALTVSTGARYTDDKRKFRSLNITPLDVSDNQLSGHVSVNYKITNSTNIYSKVARGFRAPSVQGRNVAFGGVPSVADSETILSYEAGIKTDFFNRKLEMDAAVFYYTIDGLQLSAIGGASNSNQLLNADKGVGHGFELDIRAFPTRNLTFTTGFSYNDTEIRDDLFTAVCGSGQCTPTDPLNSNGDANINGNPFQGVPRSIFNFTVNYRIPLERSRYLFAFTDWKYQGKTNLALYESKEFITNGQYEGGLRLGYKDYLNKYEVAFFVRNITDEDNVEGFVDFNNNTGFVNEPRTFGIDFRYDIY
jgi:iron complex outermembrane receptor protein